MQLITRITLLLLLFHFVVCQKQKSEQLLSDLNGFTKSFLINTNAGTMNGYLTARTGYFLRAGQYFKLSELSSFRNLSDWWLLHNGRCKYCLTLFRGWEELARFRSTPTISRLGKTLRAMEARLALAWPTFCDRKYDRCYRTPKEPLSPNLCTRAFCFFHPGSPCSERGRPARCQNATWFKARQLRCPLPCMVLDAGGSTNTVVQFNPTQIVRAPVKKPRSARAQQLERMGRSTDKAGSVQLTSKTHRAVCPNQVSCGNCQADRLDGGCVDRSPDGALLCCDCFVHPLSRAAFEF